MARTKKHLMELEKESQKKLQGKHLIPSSRKLNRDVTPTEKYRSDNDRELFAKPDTAVTNAQKTQSMTENNSWASAKPLCLSTSNSSPAFLCRAVVHVEDISQSLDVNIANMVKKQLSKGSPGGKSPAKTGASPDQASTKKPSQSEEGAVGDRTVSSSTGSCSKNIFEQFDLVGRRSPRTRSSSPRSKLSSSAQNDNCGAGSGSEEKQQMSIATAVRALRGLSGKVSEGQGKAPPPKKDRESARRSRTASPGSASPRSHASSSPKRQSPRRLSEKNSPPGATTPQKSASVKNSPSTSPVESDRKKSPTPGQRVRSPRRVNEGVTSPLSSAHSSRSSHEQTKSPAKDSDRKSEKLCLRSGEKLCCKGNNSSPPEPRREHTIHILSSTSRGSKVVQVDAQPNPPSIIRQLFVDTDTACPSSGHKQLKQCKALLSNKGLSAKSENSETESAVASSGAVPSTGTKLKTPVKSASEESESLLCAMLVGGSEVTKSYEQSREHVTPTVGKVPQSCSSTERSEQRVSESSSFFNSNDSFFDDDLTGDIPEVKPYELPVLSRLPPLKNLNLDVLELTKREKALMENGPGVQRPRGHCKKTASLLNLISRVRDCLPSGEEACRKVISDAEKILLERSSEEGTETEPSQSAADGAHEDGGSSCVKLQESAELDHDTATSCLKTDASGAGCSENELLRSSQDLDASPVCRSEKLGDGVAADTNLQHCASMSGSDSAEAAALDAPSSPSSLGELDTAKMTQAATLAVQNHIKGVLAAAKEVDKTTAIEEGKSLAAEDPPRSIKVESSSAGVLWQSSSGGAGTSSCPDESTSKAAPGGSRPSTQSQPRSFFNRISSPSKQRWKPKPEPASDTGRPGWSRWHSIMSPLPIGILKSHEKNHAPKSSAFSSKELEAYLCQSANRVVVPACRDSKLAQFLLAEGRIKDYDELQRQLSGEDAMEKRFEDEEADAKSEEDEDGEEDERDSEVARKLDPDFDEVGGLVFVSFPSEMAVTAHANVEQTLQWERDPLAYINMAKFHAFEESRRREGKIRRESQGLRGQHMKWRKYQRLYRNELRKLYEENNKDLPWPLSSLPEKTTDIHKIKNWKKKFGNLRTEDLEALELLGEEDERIKRKRKTYVFSSKKKKVKRSEPPPPSVPQVKLKEGVVDEEGEDPDSSMEAGEEEDAYGVPIPIDEDGYMDDVQSSLEEMRRKEKGLKQSKGIFSRFNMGPEDRHIFKKLGGWVTRFRRFRRMPEEMKVGEGRHRPPKKRPPKKERLRPSFGVKWLSTELVMRALMALQVEPSPDGGKGEQESSGSRAPEGLGSCENPVNDIDGEVVDLTSGESTPEKTETLHCDKPGCRYGCICHLCRPTTESDEMDVAAASTPTGRVCDKEYCRLGCICESLEKSGSSRSRGPDSSSQREKSPPPSHEVKECSKPECAEKCICQPAAKANGLKGGNDMHQLTSIKPELPVADGAPKVDAGEHAESSGDELPTLEKTAPRRQRSTDRYSNLPRRQTSYRIAKNLDAVSRKAMMMWEMSEVYSEQTSNRRKKTPETTVPLGTTSAPYAPQSPAIMSSSLPSSSSTPTSHYSSKVTAAVSVNTLPAMTSSHPVTPLVPAIPPPTAPHTTSLPSGGQPTPLLSAASQDTTPVIVSDDEGPSESQEPQSQPKVQSKRSRMKKKLFSKDEEGDAAVKKMKMSCAHPASLPTPPATPTTPSPESAAPQWHSSLICLKASNPVGSAYNNNNSDDVMEEDEIKLFEFMVNCQWERSKKEILTAITNTLKRGVYPQPRVMQVGDFRVEILPKASRPSTIPMELRSKLPKAMYSVRVKVTELPKPRKSAAPAVGVSKNSLLIPTTTIPAFYSGVSSIQGLLPVSYPGSVLGVGSAPTLVTSSSGCVTSTVEAMTSGNVGISGLGRLQITQNKVASSDMVCTQGQAMQHFKIQKDGAGVSSATPGDPPGGEKKKKKKKRKKKSVDPGDDSLVPDLSNLTVSPRGSHCSLTTGSPPVMSTFKPPSQSGGASLKPPVVATVSPSLITQPVAMQQFSKVPISPTGAPAVRPHLLSFPTLPANLSGVKFLQLPGQNNLLQIVPASALGLKAMDNKNVPNFVAVPVSLTSVATAGLGSKKAGSRVQIDVPSKVFAQAQQDIAQQSAGKETVPGADGNTATPADSTVAGEGAPAKKRKRRRKKKVPEGGEGDAVAPPSANTTVTSPILVASSPSPVMGSALPHPVEMVKNTHATRTTGGSTANPHRAIPAAAAGAGLCTGVVSHALPGGNTMTTGETTVTLTRHRLPAEKSEVAKVGSARPCPEGPGDATDAAQKCTNLAGAASDTTPGAALQKPGLGGTAATPVLTATRHAPFVQSAPGALQDGAADEDSRWSGVDSIDLAMWSDSEGEDGGISGSPAASSLGKSRSEEGMTQRRVGEQRRRADVKSGIQELRKVMDVANNLPKSLSQTKILSKAVNLIQYHHQLSEFRQRHEMLKQKRQDLIDKMLASGMTMASIQEILSQAAVADNTEEARRSSGQALSEPGDTRVTGLPSGEQGEGQQPDKRRSSFKASHSHPRVAALKHGRSIAEVDVGNKSGFVIEIEQDDQDEAVYNAEGAAGDYGGGPAAAQVVKRSHRRQDSRKDAATPVGHIKGNTAEHSGATEKVAAGSSVGTETGLCCGGRGDPRQARSSKSHPLDLTATGLPLVCGQGYDEVDGEGAGTTSDGGGADGIIGAGVDVGMSASCADGGRIDAGEDLAGQNLPADAADVPDGMGLVITSVTSLRNSKVSFDNDDMTGDGGGSEEHISNAC